MKNYEVKVQFKESKVQHNNPQFFNHYIIKAESEQDAIHEAYAKWYEVYGMSEYIVDSFIVNNPNTLNPKKTAMQLANEQYKNESLGIGWFFAIIAGALILTALIENI